MHKQDPADTLLTINGGGGANDIALDAEGDDWVAQNSNCFMLTNKTATNTLTLSDWNIVHSGYFSNDSDWIVTALDRTIYITSNYSGVSDIVTLACVRVNGTGNETLAGVIHWTELHT